MGQALFSKKPFLKRNLKGLKLKILSGKKDF